jgi:hypothetical protein
LEAETREPPPGGEKSHLSGPVIRLATGRHSRARWCAHQVLQTTHSPLPRGTGGHAWAPSSLASQEAADVPEVDLNAVL